MSEFTIRPTAAEDREWMEHFTTAQWGANFVVAHGVIYHPHKLPGFVAEREAIPAGLVTYHMQGNACEIVSINSDRPGMGMGTALLEAVKAVAQNAGCERLWLVTTNDNLNALGFYQKRGFVLVKIRRNAVEQSRLLKPSIPLYGFRSIPIRDEIELEMPLHPDNVA